MPLASLLYSCPTFCHFPQYLQANCPFGCRCVGGWACVCIRIPWASPMDSPVRMEVSLTTATPTGFTPRVFESFFPCTGTVDAQVCLAPQLFLPAYLHANVGNLVCQLPHCHESSSPWLPISAPPTSLYECFFFNSLVFGLPSILIFLQFWLFLFLNWLLAFFWLFEEVNEVFLSTPPSWLELEIK